MLTVVLLIDDHRFDVVQLSLTASVLALLLAITLLAAPISRLIGTSIMSRVMAMILVALAVHSVLSAFGSWLKLPPL